MVVGNGVLRSLDAASCLDRASVSFAVSVLIVRSGVRAWILAMILTGRGISEGVLDEVD